MNVLLKIILALYLLGFYPALSYADTSSPTNASAQGLENWQHFIILISTIETMQNNMDSLRDQLQNVKDEHERERLSEEIGHLSQDLDSLDTALEMLATGGADLSLFGVKVDKPFDIREELQSIFEPILVELRRLSERPRKIERLRSDQLYYEQRLEVADQALQSVTAYRKKAPTPELQATFKALEDRWQRRHDDLQNRVKLVKFELEQMLSPEKTSQRDTWESLKNIFGGRILNLALGVLVMIITYSLLNLLAKLYRRLTKHDVTRRRAFITRVGNLSFYLTTTLIVLLAGMSVFYVRGDWVLLGLFLIVLAGAAWAIQKSLPRFLTEAKLILNLGPVREGERVIFNNLPWEVASLNFSATLQNPLLQGGTLQIPIRELVSYNSRRFDQAESWFPSRVDDWVVLEDKTFGKVNKQTPEHVELEVFDGIKTYPVSSYINSNPYNLSQQGFTLYLSFGIDYQHQAEITTTILQQLKSELETEIRKINSAKYLEVFELCFDKADSSSLNYIARIRFHGDAASQYLEIPREFQRIVVECCNKHKWVIPFKQITLHNAV